MSTSIVHERWLGALMALCALQLPAFAAQLSEDDEAKAWKELELKLPPYPKPANLVEFEGGAASTNRFFIDTESISVGSDGVVRYTLVTKAAGGAENVSYEGIRCDMQQQKYYAFGRRGETWSNARQSEWRRIEYKDLNRQHGVLFANYFCYDRTLIKSRADAIQRLKYGPPTRNRNNE